MRRAVSALLLLFTGLALATGCTVTEGDVRDEIEDAAYCDTAADCVDVGPFCPFGCDIPVNAREADRIRDLMAQWLEDNPDDQCWYSCYWTPVISCQQGRCVADH